MRCFLPSLALLATSLMLAVPAHALTPPQPPVGYCNLDSTDPTQRSAMFFMHLAAQTPVALKALFVECSEIDSMNKGRTTPATRYGAVLEQQASVPPGTTRAQAMALLGSAIGMAATYGTQPMGLATQPTGVQIAHADSYKGILRQGEQYVIAGTQQRHATTRETYDVAAITGFTLLGGKLVTVNLVTPLRPDSFTQGGALVEAYLQALIAANP